MVLSDRALEFYSLLHFLLISSHLLDFSKSVKIVMTCEKWKERVVLVLLWNLTALSKSWQKIFFIEQIVMSYVLLLVECSKVD